MANEKNQTNASIGAAPGMMTMPPEMQKLHMEILELQRSELLLRKGQIEADMAQRQAMAQASALKRKSRERDLANDQRHLLSLANDCNHRQGGDLENPRHGNGPTALKEIVLPMTTMIHCSVCRMKVFKPHPYNLRKSMGPDETKAEAEDRKDKFHADEKLYKDLVRSMKENKLTKDSIAPMNCGTKIQFFDSMMSEVFPLRPNDNYPTQYDSSTVTIH